MNALKTFRYKLLITQQELASSSGVGVATISRLETGKVKPSIKTVRALAKSLDVAPEELYGLLTSSQMHLL